MVSSEISVWPKVSTRSRKVPITVKGSPLSLTSLANGRVFGAIKRVRQLLR